MDNGNCLFKVCYNLFSELTKKTLVDELTDLVLKHNIKEASHKSCWKRLFLSAVFHRDSAPGLQSKEMPRGKKGPSLFCDTAGTVDV